MSERPARRWFSFSLRSLLAVMTLVCIWLAWEMGVVRQRQRMLAQVRASQSFEVTTAKTWAASFKSGNAPRPVAQIPVLRRWLGDEAIQEIGYYGHMVRSSGVDVERLARLFPEAHVHETALHEPCHPGCFPRGTLVETPAGRRAIESIVAGDAVIAYHKSGERFTAQVQSVFVTDNRLWRVKTEVGELFTTETQPLCLTTDQTQPAGELTPGDTILRWKDEGLREVAVVAVTRTDRCEKVFNLVLGDCEAFVANGYLARSKPPIDAADSTAE
jgi:hypothetical protein